MKATIEITDLYAGESNYSWVKRFELESTEGLTQNQVIRRLKKLADLNGVRWRKVAECGDYMQFNFVGWYATAFIVWEY